MSHLSNKHSRHHIVFFEWIVIILLGESRQYTIVIIEPFLFKKLVKVYLIDLYKVEGGGWGDFKYFLSPNLSFIYSDMSIYFYK